MQLLLKPTNVDTEEGQYQKIYLKIVWLSRMYKISAHRYCIPFNRSSYRYVQNSWFHLQRCNFLNISIKQKIHRINHMHLTNGDLRVCMTLRVNWEPRVCYLKLFKCVERTKKIVLQDKKFIISAPPRVQRGQSYKAVKKRIVDGVAMLRSMTRLIGSTLLSAASNGDRARMN